MNTTKRATILLFMLLLWIMPQVGFAVPATPTFNITFNSDQTSVTSITGSSATPGATIGITTDGSTPTTSSPSSVANLNVATTLKMAAFTNGVTSAIATTNIIKLQTPMFTYGTAQYFNDVTEVITLHDAGAFWEYTINAGVNWINGGGGNTYLINQNGYNLGVRARAAGCITSNPNYATYTLWVDWPVISVSIDAARGTATVNAAPGVTTGTTLRYSYTGFPQDTDPIFGTPLITTSARIWVRGFKTGYLPSQNYVPRAEFAKFKSPVANITGGNYNNAISVQLTYPTNLYGNSDFSSGLYNWAFSEPPNYIPSVVSTPHGLGMHAQATNNSMQIASPPLNFDAVQFDYSKYHSYYASINIRGNRSFNPYMALSAWGGTGVTNSIPVTTAWNAFVYPETIIGYSSVGINNDLACQAELGWYSWNAGDWIEFEQWTIWPNYPEYSTDGGTTWHQTLWTTPIILDGNPSLQVRVHPNESQYVNPPASTSVESYQFMSPVTTYNYTFAVATPTIGLNWASDYSSVTITGPTATVGATLRYTVNGGTPTGASPTLPATLYAKDFLSGTNFTITAAGFKSGYTTSANATTSIGKMLTPSISPNGGAYSDFVNVSITGTNAGAINYQIAGGSWNSLPSTNTSFVLDGISVGSGTIAAYSSKTNYFVSNTNTSALFSFGVTTPTYVLAWGTDHTTVTVTGSSTTSGAIVRYTTDGSTPTGSSSTAPQMLASAGTVKMVAFKTGYAPSAVNAYAATVGTTSIFGVTPGTYYSTLNVNISTPDSVIALKYRTNGSSWVSIASSSVNVPINSTTLLEAYTVPTTALNSLTNSGTYKLQPAAVTFNPNGNNISAPTSSIITSPGAAQIVWRIGTGAWITNTALAGAYTANFDAPAGSDGTAALQAFGFTAGWDIGLTNTSANFSWAASTPYITTTNWGPDNTTCTINWSASAPALLYYTTTGVDPTTSDSTTTPTITTPKTIKAKNLNANYAPSAAVAATIVQAASPAFSVAGGTYSYTTNVTITTSEAGYTVRYRLNGGSWLSSTTNNIVVPITASTTIDSYVVVPTKLCSTTNSTSYTLQVGTITFNLNGGTFNNSTTVTISAPGATQIFYSIAGAGWQSTSAPASVNLDGISVGSGTIQAYGTAPGWTQSSTATSATFTFNVSDPTFGLAWGTDNTTVTATGTTTTTGATVRYTTDGSTPTGASTTTAPIISAPATVKAVGFKAAYNNSGTPSITFTRAATPTFSVAAGTYAYTTNITINTTATGYTIKYRLNGGSWLSSTTNNVVVPATTNITLDAYVVSTGYLVSLTNSAAYTLQPAAVTFNPNGNNISAPTSSIITSSGASQIVWRIGTGAWITNTASAGAYTANFDAPAGSGGVATLQAFGITPGWNIGATNTSANFTWTASTPYITSTNWGTDNSTCTINWSASAPALLYYTSTSVDPTTSDSTTSPTIATTKTIKAKNFTANYVPSTAAAVTIAQASSPTFSVAGGTYSYTTNVTINTSETGYTIRYRLNGGSWLSSTTNNIVVPVTTSTTIDTYVVVPTKLCSITNSTSYTLQVGAISFIPNGGTFYNAVTLSINSSGASQIAYSLALANYLTNTVPCSILLDGIISALDYQGLPISPAAFPIDGDGNPVTLVPGVGTIQAIGLNPGWIASGTLTSSTFTFIVADPLFGLAWGTDNTTVTVTGTSTTTGATVRYTTDGSTPTGASTTTAPIVSAPATVKAVGFKAAYNNSGTPSITFTRAATPTFSVASGTYGYTTNITINTTETGYTIKYRLNGGSWLSSTTNNVVVPVTVSTTIDAYVVVPTKLCSVTNSANYILQVGPITFTPNGGTFSNAVTVTINAPAATMITYNIAGTGWLAGFAPGSLTLNGISGGSGTIQAYGTTGGWNNSPTNTSATFTFIAAMPTFAQTPNGPNSAITNTARSTTVGATIYYTTDGSTPTTSSSTTPPVVSIGGTTVKAMAAAAGYQNSAIASILVTGTSPVTFTPNGHNPTSYANSAINVTLTSDLGSTITYKVGTNGTWTTTASGNSILLDGINAGWGTIQAYASKTGTLTSATNTSGEFSFRTLQPVATSSYTASNGTITATCQAGATIYYTLDGSQPTTASTVYAGPITKTTSATIGLMAAKPGYVPSAFINAFINQLISATLTSTNGVLTNGFVANNPLTIWVYPAVESLGNNYFEQGNLNNWSPNGTIVITTDTPNANIQYSVQGLQNYEQLVHNSYLGYTPGHNYSGAGWLKTPNQKFGYIGIDDMDATLSYVDPVQVNSYGENLSWLTAPFNPGATVASVADANQFSATTSANYGAAEFMPLTTFSRYAPFPSANQSDSLSAFYNSNREGFNYNVNGDPWIIAVNVGAEQITIANPYNGSAAPTGTPVQLRGWGGFVYPIASHQAPTTWTYFTNTWSGDYERVGTVYRNPVVLFNYYNDAPAADQKATGIEVWEGLMSDRPLVYITTDGSNPFSASGIAGPTTLTISNNTQGTIKTGQTGTYYISGPVSQTTINFQVASNWTGLAWGTDNTNVTITATNLTAGAQLYYTVDGSTPTTANTLYSAPVTFNSSLTFTIGGFKTNYSNGPTTALPIVRGATPTFSAAAGTYNWTTNTTINISEGSLIALKYRVNGGTWTNSTTNNVVIAITGNTTVDTCVVANGKLISTTNSVTYTLQPAAVTFNPNGNNVSAPTTSIITSPGAAQIVWRIGSGAWTTNTATAGAYTANFDAPAGSGGTAALQAFGITTNWNIGVTNTSANFVWTAATPTWATTWAADWSSVTNVFSTTTPGATIYYTTDGSVPTTSSTVGTTTRQGIQASASGMVVYSRAIAAKSNYITSGIGTSTAWQTAYPGFSPAAGTTLSNATSITLITADNTPLGISWSTNNGVTWTTGTNVTIDGSVTLLGKEGWIGELSSTTNTATYTFVVADPTFGLAWGTDNTSVTATATSTTLGATVRYTTDGSTPTGASTTTPPTITTPTTIKAVGFKTSYNNSGTATIAITQATTPTFSVAAGNYNSATNVTISTAESSFTIKYQLAGGAWVANATNNVVVPITTNAILAAYVVASGKLVSPTNSAAYTLQPTTITFTPNAGNYTNTVNVTIAAGNADRVAYSVAGGAWVTNAGPSIILPLNGIASGTGTVQAIGIHTNWLNTATATSATFTFTAPSLTNNIVWATDHRSVQVTLGTSAGTIHYTTDGSTPINSSSTYSSALTFTNTTTLTANNWINGYLPSTNLTWTLTKLTPPNIGDAQDLCHNTVPWTAYGMNYDVTWSLTGPQPPVGASIWQPGGTIWEFTKDGGNGAGSGEWNGWESTYNGVFTGVAGDIFVTSLYYRQDVASQPTYLSGMGFWMSDWSRPYSTTFLDVNNYIIADGQWHHYYCVTRLNEPMTNGVCADGPSWGYSFTPGNLYVSDLVWMKNPATYPTNTPSGTNYNDVPITISAPSGTVKWTSNNTDPALNTNTLASTVNAKLTGNSMSITRAVSWSDTALVSSETTATNQFAVAPFAMTPSQTFTNSLTVTNITPSWTIGSSLKYTNQFYALGMPANATTNSATWSGSQAIVTPQFYSFIASKPDYTPTVQNYAYQAPAATPVFVQTFNAAFTAVTNTATSTTPGATIYYTTDGTTPTTGSSTVPPVVSAAGITLKAMAAAAGYLNSAVASITTVGTLPVTFSPNSHDPISYASAPMSLTMTAEAGATIYYKTGTNGSWVSTPSGTPVTINGIDSGWGTVQAYATHTTELVSSTNTSGEFSFRTLQPTVTTSYTGTNATITAIAQSGATIYYTTDGSQPTTGSTVYSAPITQTNAGTLGLMATKPGYVGSAYVLAYVNQLQSAVLATANGPTTNGTVVNNPVTVWAYPVIGASGNNYFENATSVNWITSGGTTILTDSPNASIQYSIQSTSQYVSWVKNETSGTTPGHTYSGGIWVKTKNGNFAYAGVEPIDTASRAVQQEAVNEGWGGSIQLTWLTAPATAGATTAFVADTTTFTPASTLANYGCDIFIPITNYNRYAPMPLANQADGIVNMYVPGYLADPESACPWVSNVNSGALKLTLAHPYQGNAPANTPIVRRSYGGFPYKVCNGVAPATWTFYTGSWTPRVGSARQYPYIMLNWYDDAQLADEQFTGFEIWEGQVSDRPQMYISTDGADPYTKAGVTGPTSLTLTDNTQGTVKTGQRGNYYLNGTVNQTTIIFQVASNWTGLAWGTDNTNVTITATNLTTGAQLYYATDGSTPTRTNNLYGGPVSFNAPLTFTIGGFKTNYNNGPTTTIPIVRGATPTFNVACGTYTATTNVTLNTTESSFTLKYRLNGGAWTSSVTNNVVLAITNNTTLDAYVVASGKLCSVTNSASYILQAGNIAFNPNGGSFSNTLSVTLTGTSVDRIAYSIAGGSWVTNSGTTTNISLAGIASGTGTVQAFGLKTNWNNSVTSTSALFTFSAATPTFVQSPNPTFTGVTNTATSTTPATIIYYTTDGSTPTTSSSTTPPVVSVSGTTVKAIAAANGYLNSPVASIVVTSTTGVTFSPNGHDPVSYANSAINVTLTSDVGSTISYKIGTNGTWTTTTSGNSITLDGINTGWGTIQAYATSAAKLSSATNTSGEFSFRLVAPTITSAYTSSNGTITVTGPAGATFRYTLDGTQPNPSSTLYAGPITSSTNVTLGIAAFLPGYVASPFVLAYVNQLTTPVFTTTNGILTTNLTANNDLDLWVYPQVDPAANSYFETGTSANWSLGSATITNDTPGANYQFSAVANTSFAGLWHYSSVGYTAGHIYSGGLWMKAPNGNLTISGTGDKDQTGAYIMADDQSSESPNPTPSYLTQALNPGAATMVVANATPLMPNGTWFADIGVPLTNVSRYTPFPGANQASDLTHVMQHSHVWTSTDQTLVPYVLAANTNTGILTLGIPWNGPAVPVGTPIVRRSWGSQHNYDIYFGATPATWTYQSGPFISTRAGTARMDELIYLNWDGNTPLSFATGIEVWEGQTTDRPKLLVSTDGTSAYTKSGASGPTKLRLTGNQMGIVRAGATGTYYINATEATRTITFQVAPTVTTLAWGTENTAVTITASNITAGANLYYTQTGAIPTTNSTLYSSGVTITVPTTFEIAGFRANYNNGAVTTNIITQANAPTFSLASGTNNWVTNVTISTSESAFTLKYRSNGGAWTSSATNNVVVPITINTIVDAYVVATGKLISPTNTATYTLQPGAITFSPNGGNFTNSVPVTISASNATQIIYSIAGGPWVTNSAPTTINLDGITTGTGTIAAYGATAGWANTTTATSSNFVFTCNTPTLSLNWAPDYTSVTVTGATATAGATLRYTLNGATPTAGSAQLPITLYSKDFLAGTNFTITEAGFKTNYITSANTTTNINKLTTPAISPNGGTYAAAVTLSLTATNCNVLNFKIGASSWTNTTSTNWSTTLDGLDSGTGAITAWSIRTNWFSSDTNSVNFTFQTAMPTIAVAWNSDSTVATLSASSTTPGATTTYTTNGTTPLKTASTPPISVNQPTNFKFEAFKNAYLDSTVTNFALLQAAPPTINPTNGSTILPLAVTISGTGTFQYQTNAGAWVNYTVPLSLQYVTNLNARAFVTNLLTSPVVSAYYTGLVYAVTYSPNGGTFNNTISVTMASSNATQIAYKLGTNGTWLLTNAPAAIALSGIDAGIGSIKAYGIAGGVFWSITNSSFPFTFVVADLVTTPHQEFTSNLSVYAWSSAPNLAPLDIHYQTAAAPYPPTATTNSPVFPTSGLVLTNTTYVNLIGSRQGWLPEFLTNAYLQAVYWVLTPAQTFSNSLTVTASPVPASTAWYTVGDEYGNPPTNTPTTIWSGTMTVTNSATFIFLSTPQGLNNQTQVTYSATCVAPTFSPDLGGIQPVGQYVTINGATKNSTLLINDGGAVTTYSTNSVTYGPVKNSGKLLATAQKSGWIPSTATSLTTYTNGIIAPIITPASSASFTPTLTVTISNLNSNIQLWYRLDQLEKNAPTWNANFINAGILQKVSLTLSNSARIQAYARNPFTSANSTTTLGTFARKIDAPTIFVTNNVACIILANAPPEPVIWVNGTPYYSDQVTYRPGINTTVNAYATANNWATSDTVTANLTPVALTPTPAQTFSGQLPINAVQHLGGTMKIFMGDEEGNTPMSADPRYPTATALAFQTTDNQWASTITDTRQVTYQVWRGSTLQTSQTAVYIATVPAPTVQIPAPPIMGSDLTILTANPRITAKTVVDGIITNQGLSVNLLPGTHTYVTFGTRTNWLTSIAVTNQITTTDSLPWLTNYISPIWNILPNSSCAIQAQNPDLVSATNALYFHHTFQSTPTDTNMLQNVPMVVNAPGIYAVYHQAIRLQNGVIAAGPIHTTTVSVTTNDFTVVSGTSDEIFDPSVILPRELHVTPNTPDVNNLEVLLNGRAYPLDGTISNGTYTILGNIAGQDHVDLRYQKSGQWRTSTLRFKTLAPEIKGRNANSSYANKMVVLPASLYLTATEPVGVDYQFLPSGNAFNTSATGGTSPASAWQPLNLNPASSGFTGGIQFDSSTNTLWLRGTYRASSLPEYQTLWNNLPVYVP